MQPHNLAHDAFEQALYRVTKAPAGQILLGLGRIKAALRRVQQPQRRLRRVVHVAGTNGKGSTIAFLRAIFQAHQWQVVSTTSPHLVSFAERLLLPNNEPMPFVLFHKALQQLQKHANNIPLTPFEASIAAIFLIAARIPHDVCLLETGLGGRLDATNVVTPTLSVITPIDIDHADMLGHTIDRIAYEKAGIIKPHVPVVCSTQHPQALQVLQQVATQRHAPLIQAPAALPDLPTLALAGAHQQQNAATAYIAAQQMLGQHFCPQKARHGLAHAQHAARLQRMTYGIHTLWLDGAHNVHGALACAAFAATMQPALTHILFCCGKNRDEQALWQPFAGLQLPKIALATPPDAALRAHMHGDIVLPTIEALPAYLQAQTTPMHVLITGSLYLCGAVLKHRQFSKNLS